MAKETIRQYNLDLIDGCPIDGQYGMPVLLPEDYLPEKLLPFNFCLSTSKTNFGVHFFIDDYQFERVWRNPQRYANMLKKYDCVLSPDFSLYSDMPKAMQIYNTYRSRALGYYWQTQGIRVIPTVSWSDEDSFDFCFDGLPHKATLAVSTVGTGYHKSDQQAFQAGMSEMLKRLEPTKLIVYGSIKGYDLPNDVEVKRYENPRTKLLHENRKQTRK